VTGGGDPPPFHIVDSPPGAGLTVIEASAGTGKTYTLTSLVVRYVAEGTPLSEILAVTFTRMATGELRDRIRGRLVGVHRGLGGDPAGSADDLVRTLGDTSPEEVVRRVGRLGDALADFDAATIATTHGFCQMVLHGLGSAGDTAADTVLLEDPSDLVAEVVDDLYLRWGYTIHGPAPFRPGVARRAALEAVRNPDTHIYPFPQPAPPASPGPAAILARLAAGARREVARRLLAEDVLTYDELLGRLARTLDDPLRGPEACRRLSERYSVVLVDEFQDTDPVQWTILQKAFTTARTRLILIGDPKQAIYSFRGADVHSYLDAAAQAGSRLTLDENWRSDQPLLDAIDALFSPLQFGHQGIPFRSVEAPPPRRGPGLTGAPVAAPLRIRMVDDSQPGIRRTMPGYLQKGSLVNWIADDLAADVGRLLTSPAAVRSRQPGHGRVEPADIAVLTRTNAQAITVRDALRRAGIPSVVAGTDSVLRSEATQAWLRLLEAVQEPTSRSRLVALALTPLIGMRPVEVATAADERWEDLHDRVHRWASVLAERGVAALYRTITAEEGLPGRVLAEEGGERTLTDLGHVAQLLHAEATANQLGAPSLRTWLAARARAADDEQSEGEERSRRLDSDAAAVQVLTVHRAKGLEFPVVYCPFLWDGGQVERNSPPIVFHDPESGGRRTLDPGCPDQSREATRLYAEHAALARAEREGEDLRLMYVAVTRACHQVVLWWGRGHQSGRSPLARILLARDPLTGEVGVPRSSEPNAKLISSALRQLADRAPGLISVEPAAPSPTTEATDRKPALGSIRLEAARFDRSLDLRWRRASYSSITAAAHGQGRPSAVSSEPEEPGLSDEPASASAGPADADGVPGARTGVAPSEWAGLAGGAEVGTFVHRVLEVADFAAPDLEQDLHRAIATAARSAPPPVDPAGLATALHQTLVTPLGRILPGVALAGIGRPDRLDELGFELPVAGGDRPVGSVRTADLADLIGSHLPAHGRLGGYADLLRDPLLDTVLRGYLVGSLDLVFRRVTGSGPPRWYVADYKTNWLAPSGELLDAGHYTPEAMEAEMVRRHYPLQALFYMVALHRYLRWRQPGYRPDHLGGVLYLFVRGMVGPATPAVAGETCGVYPWAVPPELVVQLSDALDGPIEASRP
jgi:exodeoxyribonuclease V beta subunit